MMLLLDVTQPDRVLVGLIRPKERVLQKFRESSYRHETVLTVIEDFLRFSHISPSRITSCLLVAGPGRFSQLRVGATIANTVSWAYGWKLFSVSASRFTSTEAQYLKDLFNRSRYESSMVKPRYGQPPSITKPKRRTSR